MSSRCSSDDFVLKITCGLERVVTLLSSLAWEMIELSFSFSLMRIRLWLSPRLTSGGGATGQDGRGYAGRRRQAGGAARRVRCSARTGGRRSCCAVVGERDEVASRRQRGRVERLRRGMGPASGTRQFCDVGGRRSRHSGGACRWAALAARRQRVDEQAALAARPQRAASSRSRCMAGERAEAWRGAWP
ncbi:hypothetical protein PR202_ga21361 [Eleusine coracana subsp. coracana]|uniref:Uncharacterized protein n=1 Tax=Eleusine coracana subsp. coracana TaxID=191504 RepID=A0AAV5D0G8_ELECO|nr:hypothetical protein PR202_ga21361 [Eleusine coracana subsp. coracana]